MEIAVANQRIFLFDEQISVQHAEDKAWSKKMDSFGTINKVGSFLSRPKDEDFELLYKEYRYQPFWHVIAKARYVYERNANYQIKASTEVVRTVTINSADYQVTNGHIHVPVLEHCVQEEHEELLIDGVTGKQRPELNQYLKLSPILVTEELESKIPKEAILVPPQTRVSGIIRESMSKMIKGIQADTILEEHVEIECVDLYYYPIYAFQYLWKSKNKEAIIEVDAISGTITTGTRIFREYLGKMLDRDFLFDIGADTAGLFIPGGTIAVKAAKKYMDTHNKK